MYNDEKSFLENKNLFRSFNSENITESKIDKYVLRNRKKILLGWNLGVGIYPQKRLKMKILSRIIMIFGFSHYIYNLLKTKKHTIPKKLNKVHAVFSDQNNQRKAIIDKIRKDGRFLMQKTSSRKYNVQIAKSKIVISPFGNGEICFRDFEAVIANSLLIKPNMDHIKTYPDIYKPFKTYVPVNWNLSDFDKKVDYYLKNENERQELVSNAYQILVNELNDLNSRVSYILKEIKN